VLLLLQVKVNNFFLIFISIIKINIFLALQCYSHEICSTNCPQLSGTIKTCTGDDNKCYKGAFPGGVARGCAKERCNVQVISFIY
jgi:hypothetical protein